jgi:hypothetical protein
MTVVKKDAVKKSKPTCTYLICRALKIQSHACLGCDVGSSLQTGLLPFRNPVPPRNTVAICRRSCDLGNNLQAVLQHFQHPTPLRSTVAICSKHPNQLQFSKSYKARAECISWMVTHLRITPKHVKAPGNEQNLDRDGYYKFDKALLAVMQDPEKGWPGSK